MFKFVTLNTLNKNQIIDAFVALGKSLTNIPEHIIETANIRNSWFTIPNIKLAAENWKTALNEHDLNEWIGAEDYKQDDKKVGIIMAGNIPLVGLHDLLSAIASGHKVVAKLSSQDEILMGHAIILLTQQLPELESRIEVSEQLKGIDYLIATGSNNSSRYFEHYFKGIPCLIRKNRTSIAIVNGNESDEELIRLADDIYTYFGLGCRNVTHLLLPRNIELRRLYEAYDKYIDIVHHNKYYNNYMYHKSILLMNLSKHYDNGFMLFQEKEELHAPIATLNYHFYDTKDEALAYIEKHKDELQCVVSKDAFIPDSVQFGDAQKPKVTDYADGVNVIEFLKN